MSIELTENLKNREKIISNLKEELIGPLKDFKYAQIIDEQTSKEELENDLLTYYYGGVREEIFNDGKPSKKYAAALLYPNSKVNITRATEDLRELELENEYEGEINSDEITDETINEATNEIYKQSTMGFTFAIDKSIKSIDISFKCGIYEEKRDFNKDIQSNSRKTWWMRKSQSGYYEVDLQRPEKTKYDSLKLIDSKGVINNYHNVNIYSHIRNITADLNIVTITIENATESKKESGILFQCQLTAETKKGEFFSPYPNLSEMNVDVSKEDKHFELLYLTEKNYSFGHDCSTSWEFNNEGKVNLIETTFLPEYEIKTMTPDILIDDEPLLIHHAELIGAEKPEELISILSPLVDNYEKWYEGLLQEKVQDYYVEIKEKNLEEISKCIKRMRKGLELLEIKEVYNCFKLTNLAMLMQMNNGKEIRKVEFENNQLHFSNAMNVNGFDTLNFDTLDELYSSVRKKFENNTEIFTNSKWRGFQIAFILQSLDGLVNKTEDERDIVDLIWFPTGGGKTEAYLGVAAFSMLYRRYIDNEDTGVDIIMRYTLRLLTADQFQRSSRLICSLEYIRSNLESILGMHEYSIGLWVGGDTTPNKVEDAKQKYYKMKKANKSEFIVESCPWCGAEMKVIKIKKNHSVYEGYNVENSIVTHCPDKNCHFHKKLPIKFIDEMIYKEPPTFLIGTIDKFTQLAWKPEARFLFGINKKGMRYKTPPNLIIQDELHLISGPLGSLTGMFEVLIENLCTDNRGSQSIKPKIIGATATIKSYEEQIKAIFGREKSGLFPPSGININDNFFSKVKKDKSGKDVPGRKYIGIYTTTQGKLQSQVQTISSLLISSNEINNIYKDPFWTIVSFYNTIKDIGKAKTLTELDIPNTLDNYYEKRKISKKREINQSRVKELTSRMSSKDVANYLTELKNKYNEISNKSVDICLASNILEVGVDIDRLALMTIIGQPKSTAQYIQVSGRVGRKPDVAPGLIITIYNRGDSNDKSHYEHFIEYHQKLYANVEELSITPFSNFSINRGLPAVLVGYIRQNFDYYTVGLLPNSNAIKRNIENISQFIQDDIIKKMKLVDTKEIKKLEDVTNSVYERLTIKDYESWETYNNKEGVIERLYTNRNDMKEGKLEIISAMRNVDSTSRLEPRNLYSKEKKFNFTNEV